MKAVKAGAAISAGIEHDKYSVTMSVVPDAMRASLAEDLG